MCSRKITVTTFASYMACLTGLFPCVFGALNSVLGGGAGVTILYMISLLCAIYAVIGGNYKIHLDKRRYYFVVILFGILALSILNRNRDIEKGWYLQVITYAYIVRFAILILIDSKGKLRKGFFKIFMIYLGIQLIMGFYYLVNPDSLITFGTLYFELTEKAYSWFKGFVDKGAFMGIVSHYSTSGIYMANGTILLSATILSTKNRDGKWNKRLIIWLIIFSYALILTQKRAHLLFTACAIVLIYIVGYLKGNYKNMFKQMFCGLIVIGLIVITLLQLPAFQIVLSRFMIKGNLNTISTGRVDNQWIPALQLFYEYPLFGIGWRQSIGRLKAVEVDVHNIYIQLLCENGIIFGVPIIILMFYAVWKTYKLLKKVKYSNNYEEYGYIMVSFAYQVFFLLYGLTGNPLYDMQCNFPYLICLAIVFSYNNRIDSKYIF